MADEDIPLSALIAGAGGHGGRTDIGFLETPEELEKWKAIEVLGGFKRPTQAGVAKINTNLDAIYGQVATRDEENQAGPLDISKEDFRPIVNSRFYLEGRPANAGANIGRVFAIPTMLAKGVADGLSVKKETPDYDAALNQLRELDEKQASRLSSLYGHPPKASTQSTPYYMRKALDDLKGMQGKYVTKSDWDKYMTGLNKYLDDKINGLPGQEPFDQDAFMDKVTEVIKTYKEKEIPPQKETPEKEKPAKKDIPENNIPDKKRVPTEDSAEYKQKTTYHDKGDISTFIEGAEWIEGLRSGYVPIEVLIQAHNNTAGVLNSITDIQQISTAEGRLEKESNVYEAMANLESIKLAVAEYNDSMSQTVKKRNIHNHGWNMYL